MGRAIVRQPKVFLFDEPLSNLDAKLRTQMRAEIKRLHKRLGATSIYVTHDQVEAMTLADRIVVMQDGRIEQIGSPMDLFLNPANTFVASFMGSPPMNQVRARVNGSDTAPIAEFFGQSLRLPPLDVLRHAQGREVILGIRPEFIAPVSGAAEGKVAIEVDLIETLGSEALIHSSFGDDPFIIKVSTEAGANALDAIDGFTISPNQIKLFDAETGRVLAGQESR